MSRRFDRGGGRENGGACAARATARRGGTELVVVTKTK